MQEAGISEATWPLVGRVAELDHLTQLLQAGRGAAVLAGPAGVGKTRLALEWLAKAATQGFVPIRVAATRGAAGVPFGAFAQLIPDVGSSTDLLSLLRQIAHAVKERGEGKPVAVVVDDAHLLDQSSALLTQLLAATEETFVLATLRSGEPAPDAVVALWKDGTAERVELGPLTIQQVEKVLEDVLGGPVDGVTVHRLQKRTRGNALFLRELVLNSLASGVLGCEEGVWRLGGSLPPSSRLVEIIEARLSGLDDPVRRTLGVLALGEPLEVELLQVVDSTTDLEALERRGLVRIEKHGRRLLAQLPHPLYGEVLRQRLSPLVARTSAAALAGALERTGARRREDTLRLAIWSLDGDRSLKPGIMLVAATTARERYDFPLAERLARGAIEGGAGFEARLLLAQACWLQGRAEEALQQLATMDDSATTDAQRTLLAMARIGVLDWSLRQTDQALRVAEEAEIAIDDLACRDQITAERARILGRSGRNGDAVALAVPLLNRVSGPALVSACFAAGTSMSVTGQFAGAIEASERGLAAHLELTGPPLPFGPYLHLVIRCKALMNAGRLAEGRALGQREYDKAVTEGSLEAQSFFSLDLAWGALLEGRVANADRIAGEAAGAFRELGWRLWVRNALALRTHALALLGEPKAASGVLSELDALGVPEVHHLGPEVAVARAWTAVAAGNHAQALAHLEEAAAMARWAGASALESAALHDMARLGRADEVASRLGELTEVVEGDLARARAVHAASLATQDPTGLEVASSTFEDCGALLVAAEASADAAVAWRRAGQPRRATAAERHSKVLAAFCEGAHTPSLAVVAPARAVLTPRELEIARLVARGLSDKEVAARLFISHRTVENRLHTVYEKLGLERRAELQKALEGY
jgi:DNA-binding CsgD family transcriptional regulator